MSERTNTGVGVAGLLGVAFVVLKLCKVIDWSWWLVTLPFWAGLAVLAFILLICGAIIACAKIWEQLP